LRKNIKGADPSTGNGSDDFYKPGAGVLAPRGNGEYRAGSQKNFLKRRSGKPMSERASRLAQMQHGEGYSRGQYLTDKATAATAADKKELARARARQQKGAMIMGSNVGSNQNKNSPKRSQGETSALPDGWTQHRHETGRVYYCNRATGATQWERPATDETSWGAARAAAAAAVGNKRTETPSEDYDDYYAGGDDSSDSDPLMQLKQQMETTEAHVDKLQSKEEELLQALEQVRIKKQQAMSRLSEQQTAYQDALLRDDC